MNPFATVFIPTRKIPSYAYKRCKPPIKPPQRRLIEGIDFYFVDKVVNVEKYRNKI